MPKLTQSVFVIASIVSLQWQIVAALACVLVTPCSSVLLLEILQTISCLGLLQFV